MSVQSACHAIVAAGDDLPKTWHDYQQIASVARKLGVETHVVGRRSVQQLRVLPLWTKRCLSIAPANVQRRKLLPGRFLSGTYLGKVEELTILEASGVPIPKWIEIKPSTRLDPEEWGPYVVEKPSHGRKGAFVRIRKTNRIRYVPPEELPKHMGGPKIAQRFIYTGQWPINYRVVTFFGEVILCFREITRDHGAPLRSRWAFGDGGGISIVANTKKMEVTMVEDERLMELASRAHKAAFPDIPLLQFDIVQDAESGQYLVLECHPWHPWWPFSSLGALSVQKDHGVDFDGQFGAMERVGRIVALKAQDLAAWVPPRITSSPVRARV
jgi:hypothetical protein